MKINLELVDSTEGLDPDTLYTRVIQQSVPYYEWHDWIGTTMVAWREVTDYQRRNISPDKGKAKGTGGQR